MLYFKAPEMFVAPERALRGYFSLEFPEHITGIKFSLVIELKLKYDIHI